MGATLNIPSILALIRSQTAGQPSQSGMQGGDGITPQLIDAIIRQESGGRAKARGKAGELGLMQIKPEVGQMFGVQPSQLLDPDVNRRVGTQYLQSLFKQFGDVPTALAAYNAGPGNVRRGRVGKSTNSYVSRILGSLSGGLEGTAQAAELPPALRGAKEVASPWTKQLEGSEVANPWSKTTASTPKTTPESFYERRIAKPLTGGLASVIGHLDPRGSPFSGATEEAARTPRIDPTTAQSIASNIVPQDLTSAGVDAGLAASGLGEWGLLTRLGIAGLGGATGSTLQGQGPTSGAGRGIVSGLGGELIGGVTGIAGRTFGKKALLKETTADIGGTLGKTLGSKIGIRAPESVAALERVFKLGGATQKAGQIAGNISRRAEQALAGGTFRIDPALSDTPVTLAEAEDIIQSLNEGTYLPSGGARGVQGRAAMLRQAHTLREHVARRLNTAMPGMGTLWRQSRRDLGAANTLQGIFQEPGVLENEVINQPKLEALITSKKYWNRLNNTLGPDEARQLLRTVRRGGVGPSTDIPGSAPHVRFGMMGHPHFGMPRTYKPAGKIPTLMRKAGQNPMRIPGGVATSDALGFLNAPIDEEGQ